MNINANSYLKLSPLARFVDVDEEYTFLYNTLFGGGMIVEKSLLKYLNNFQNTLLSDHKNILDESLLKKLAKGQLLVPLNSNGRETLKDELEERKSNLHTGMYYDRLHLSTTNKCNMGCSYCFCNTFDYKELGTMKRFPLNQMPFDVAQKTVEKSIETLKKNNKNHLSIEFFGGEPLLNSRVIIETLEHFGDGSNYGVSIEYGCTTNGSSIEDELIKHFKDNDVRVAISLDYIKQSDKTFRGDGNVNVSWETIKLNIEKMADAGIRMKVQSVLSSETWDNYSYELIDFCSEKNIETLGIILSFDFDFYKEHAPKSIADKVLDYYDYAINRGVQISGYWYLSFLGIINPSVWEQRRAWKTCPTIGRLLSVETDGSVYACKTTNRKLGHIDEFDSIFKSPNYEFYAMRAFSNAPECEGCVIEGFCSGNCTGAVENEFGKISSVDHNYCVTVIKIIDGLLERHFKSLPITEMKH